MISLDQLIIDTILEKYNISKTMEAQTTCLGLHSREYEVSITAQ